MAEILVCDDDKAIVEAIEIYLSQEGHHILKAYDGEEALRKLRDNPVDLLVIDASQIYSAWRCISEKGKCLRNRRTDCG